MYNFVLLCLMLSHLILSCPFNIDEVDQNCQYPPPPHTHTPNQLLQLSSLPRLGDMLGHQSTLDEVEYIYSIDKQNIRF